MAAVFADQTDPQAANSAKPRRHAHTPLRLTAQQAGEAVAAYASDDYWMDIGRPDDYEIADRDYTAAPERFVPPHKS